MNKKLLIPILAIAFVMLATPVLTEGKEVLTGKWGTFMYFEFLLFFETYQELTPKEFK